MRTFAITHINENIDIGENIISKLPNDCEIYVFCDKEYDFSEYENVKTLILPNDILSHNTKVKNYVTKYFFDNNFRGFLHEIEESVQIINDTSVFLNRIERMMIVLRQKSWFNTTCDGCNYVYSKYNPRIIITVDEDETKDIFSGDIAWCSNANTAWITYNYDIASFNDVKFDEKYDFPMYYIIKFLAERRNNKNPGELYYMNLYPSIVNELNVFKSIENTPKSKFSIEFTNEMVKNENKMFMNEHISNQPDVNYNMLIEDIHNVILSHKN